MEYKNKSKKYDEYMKKDGYYEDEYSNYIDDCKDDYKDDYDEYPKDGYKDDYKDEYMEDYKYKPKMVEVDRVLGIGQAETFTEVCIPLCPPAFEVMEDLIGRKIVFDALVAGKDKVFVNGRLIKDIPYKTKNVVKYPGCNKISKLTLGDVKHATAEIGFALCIDVPGSVKGAKVVVLKSDVNSVEIPNHRRCLPDKCVAQCEPAFIKKDECITRPILSITEKDCIFIKVKAVKPEIITLPHKTCDKY
jgi:hypothetical protein